MLMPDLFGDSDMIFLSFNHAVDFQHLAMDNRMTQKKLRTYFLLLCSILVILGTFTYSLILKSMVIYIRHSGWLLTHETFIMVLIIIALLFFTLLFAKWLTIWLTESVNTRSKNSFIIPTAILFCISLIYWIPENEISFEMNPVSQDQRFTGGPYPDAITLTQLKAEGYTTIISWIH